MFFPVDLVLCKSDFFLNTSIGVSRLSAAATSVSMFSACPNPVGMDGCRNIPEGKEKTITIINFCAVQNNYFKYPAIPTEQIAQGLRCPKP